MMMDQMPIDISSIAPPTLERAARVAERCNFRVVGYVMEHAGGLPKRAIVAESVRWFPNESDFESMMGWRKHSAGPGIPAEGWAADEMPAPPPVAAPMPDAATPSRPVLTAPPTANMLASTEDALGALARDLGCHWNNSIPHNAGWFVPGKPTAYASAYDAIQGLVTSLKNGGTVYAPAHPTPHVAEAMAASMSREAPASAPRSRRAPSAETAQESLF